MCLKGEPWEGVVCASRGEGVVCASEESAEV